MYSYRIWQPSDLAWLQWATTQSAWESLSPEDRAAAKPDAVVMGALTRLGEGLGSPMGTACIALAGGAPVGFVVAAVGPDSTTGEPMGHLLDLWVAPQHRRRGLARYLQAMAEALMARTGLRKVKLWTGVHNEAAVNLARKAGYSPAGLIGTKTL